MKPEADLWQRVAKRLRVWSNLNGLLLYGQQHSVKWIAAHLADNGVIIADEVGLGKTRLALLAMLATLEEGGSVVAVIPPGLIFQWEQEAEAVCAALDRQGVVLSQAWKSTPVRTYADLFHALSEREKYPLAAPKQGRWVLLSQTFDMYRVRGNAQAWRFELPTLIRAHWAIKSKKRGNNRWIHYWKQRGGDSRSFEDHNWLFNQDKAAKFLSTHRFPNDIKALFEDERLRPNRGDEIAAEDSCTAYFREEQGGRKLLRFLIGRLIGPVDLLVIDEAHKSREEGDEPRKRLGRLLDGTLQLPEQHRRISMTATPIELGPEQWIALLRRTGLTAEQLDPLRVKIDNFASALSRAQDYPDQQGALQQLGIASQAFAEALRPFVTRRRRLNQGEMRKLVPSELTGAHPHRALGTCTIEIEGLDDGWRSMVLALEGQGLAAKGLDGIEHRQRQADIRYSSGLSCEFDLPEPTAEQELSRKERRMLAWAATQRRLSVQIAGSDGHWLWRHPRVVRAADRVEELCEFRGLSPREKVLVFGRFSEPMRALRDTLNARHILRILDLGGLGFLPKLKDEGDEPLLMHVYSTQNRANRFTGALCGARLGSGKLRELRRTAQERYDSTRDRLLHLLNIEREDWMMQLPRSEYLLSLKQSHRADCTKLVEIIRSDVFDVLLQQRADMEKITLAELLPVVKRVWREHIACILNRDDDVQDAAEVIEQIKSPRSRAPKVSEDLVPAKLPSFLTQYLDHEPRSGFCRLLNGEVKQETRRAIQTAFNRRETGPYVLIAQSQVGREGLNLHKACRRVFLFHPEWNPGVLEQQIGRVDRIESLWTQMAKEWMAQHGLVNGTGGSFPRIEVESLVFRGTYDQHQANVLGRRRTSLNAQLFGALLDEESLARVPPEYQDLLAQAAPSWEPGDDAV